MPLPRVPSANRGPRRGRTKRLRFGGKDRYLGRMELPYGRISPLEKIQCDPDTLLFRAERSQSDAWLFSLAGPRVSRRAYQDPVAS